MRERTEADDICQGAFNRALLDLILPGMRRAAKDAGYAITVHGSLNRDIDLVAVPWREHNVWSMDALLDVLLGAARAVTGRCNCERKEWTVKPHGRRTKAMLAWVGETTVHLDLSVMPTIGSPENLNATD
jgi:hypothetical protein